MSETWTGLDVIDTDHHFIINPFTREITSKNPQKDILIKNDHNSERFTFEIPRYIEGRDVGKCNVVQVCYTNGRFSGVYTVDDMAVYPFVNDMLTCSWLISQNATKSTGKLSFMLRFAQVNDNATVEYAWSTKTYDNVRILETIDAVDKFEDEYVDAIQQWKNELEAEMKVYVDKTVDTNIDVAQIGRNAQNISELETDLAVQKSRMDTFTALEDGSTTGDAELADIRVGVDGSKYSGAGVAVREQISNLQNQLVYGWVTLNRNPAYSFEKNSYAKLTLPGRTEVFCNGAVYSIDDVDVKFDFTESYTLFNILFDCVTNLVSIQYFRTAIPENNVIIGWAFAEALNLNVNSYNIWQTTPIDGYNPIDLTVWCSDVPTMIFGDSMVTLTLPQCHINTGYLIQDIAGRTAEYGPGGPGLYNILYSLNLDEVSIQPRSKKIPIGYQRIGVIHTSYGVFLNGATNTTNVNNMALAPLILGAGNQFIEFDSINKTVTFPNDTLILNNRSFIHQKDYYQLATSKSNNVISYADETSSALIIYYDTTANTLGLTQYNQIVVPTKIPIASFRTSCGQVAVNAPYKWDGKPFNMTPSDLGIPEYGDVDFKMDFMVESINHRGYCKEAPENTLSAYRLSAAKRFNYVECDVAFTSDNVPVLLHDSTIDRTSNGTGNISEMTLEEVRAYDFGSWFSTDYAGEQIPTFEEFIILCKRLGLHPYIEIKSAASYTQEQIDMFVDIVKRNGMKGNVSYISFNSTYLKYIKNTDPDARLGYVVGGITADTISTAQALSTGTNEVFIDANYGGVTDDAVNLCIDADLPLEVWTVNDAAWITGSMPQYISGVSSDNIHAGRTLYETYK